MSELDTYVFLLSPTGVFLNSTEEVADTYYLEIAPARWTYAILVVIYAWQASWLAYALSTICRRSLGGFLYMVPNVWPPALFLIFMANNACNVTWLFLWDRHYIGLALIPMLLSTCSLLAAICFSCNRLYHYSGVYMKEGLRKDIWAIRILCHNGLACYAAWALYTSLINIAMVLSYRFGVPQDVTSTMALAILGVILFLWFALDNFVLDKWVRYIVTPYLVIFVALEGSIYRNWDPTGRNSIFMAVLMATAGLLIIIKIIIMIWRFIRGPLYDSNKAVFYDYGL